MFMLILNAMKFLHFHLTGIPSRTDTTDCGNAIKILHSASGDFVIIYVHGPRKGRCHDIKIYIPPSREYNPESTVPLAGMQLKFYIPASGDFVIISNSRSPRAGMHIKIYIPPSREYDPESTVPLAEMQSKYCIPASGDFVIISVHGPRERRCT